MIFLKGFYIFFIRFVFNLHHCKCNSKRMATQFSKILDSDSSWLGLFLEVACGRLIWSLQATRCPQAPGWWPLYHVDTYWSNKYQHDKGLHILRFSSQGCNNAVGDDFWCFWHSSYDWTTRSLCLSIPVQHTYELAKPFIFDIPEWVWGRSFRIFVSAFGADDYSGPPKHAAIPPTQFSFLCRYGLK